MEQLLEQLVYKIYNLGCLQFGNFTLKSGQTSSFYFDLRLIVSVPGVLKDVSQAFLVKLKEDKVSYDVICGVPYSGIPLATCLSAETEKPLLICRKEVKSYGMKKMVEGLIDTRSPKNCILIEDVVSTGSSVLETVTNLEAAGLVVKDICVILVRDSAGTKNLEKHGYNVHSLFNLSELLHILYETNLISAEQRNQVTSEMNMNNEVPEVLNGTNYVTWSYGKRSGFCSSPVGKELFLLIEEKSSNLCVAADFTSIDEIKKLAISVGPYICVLKLHYTIIHESSDSDVIELKKIANKFQFMILEDRKLCDIGNTVSMQFAEILKLTNLVTAHSISGPGVIEGIKKAVNNSEKAAAVFLVAEMSSEDNLIDKEYTEKTIKMAELHSDTVIGIVSQKHYLHSPGLIQLTPGISFNDSGDQLGQQYRTPEEAVKLNFADIAVVGRSIIHASDPEKMAKKYRDSLWRAYLERINSSD